MSRTWKERLCRVLSIGACLSASACRTALDDSCLAQFSSAQAVVLQVNSKELTSVDASIAALDGALAACRAASRRGEVEELERARAQLSSHREQLERQREMIRQRTELPKEELERIVKQGDPKCPRGQGYLHKKSGQRIRCVGPQPIEMDKEAAKTYFKGRNYRLLEGVSADELRFEYGAELLVFRYAPGASALPPSCVLIYPPPDQSWQELTARLTGVSPARLKPGIPVSTSRGALPMVVEERTDKVLVRIGACDN